MWIMSSNTTPIVRCRTGSLENQKTHANEAGHVRCRTGSLEKKMRDRPMSAPVRCRTGSLETVQCLCVRTAIVRCRAGSLEKTQQDWLDNHQVRCRAGSLKIHSPVGEALHSEKRTNIWRRDARSFVSEYHIQGIDQSDVTISFRSINSPLRGRNMKHR